MKSLIRPSKTAVAAANHLPKSSGKMVLTNVAYSASEKKTPFKDPATKKSSDEQATAKKK